MNERFKKLKKTVCYRVYSFLILWILLFLIIREPLEVTGLSFCLELIKMIGYYIFEILWDKFDKNDRF